MAEIAGVSAGAVREFLLEAAEVESWDLAYVAKALAIDRAAAAQVVQALEASGYVERAGKGWRNTAAGNAVAGVSKARPIKRETIRKSLDALVARVKELNAREDLLYRITKVVLYGPYLTTKQELLKNADVAVELMPKIADRERLERLGAERARESGRRFASHAARAAWPRAEVLQLLRGPSRAIAVRELGEGVLERPHKVLFEIQSRIS